MLLRKIFLNQELYQWKVVNEASCTFCANSPENPQHIFVECDIVTKIWNDIKMWMAKYNILLEVNTNSILFGCIEFSTNFQMISFIILITKWYIYKSRCENKKPAAMGLKSLLIESEICEKYNAKIQNKMDIHEKKWQNIKIKDFNVHN